MSQYNINAPSLTKTYGLLLKSKHNKYIMDLKVLKQFSQDDIFDINLVRLYIKANSLAELTKSKGNCTTSESAFDGQPDDQESMTQSPQQMEPTPHQVWR
jgi:hypothetical protein